MPTKKSYEDLDREVRMSDFAKVERQVSDTKYAAISTEKRVGKIEHKLEWAIYIVVGAVILAVMKLVIV